MDVSKSVVFLQLINEISELFILNVNLTDATTLLLTSINVAVIHLILPLAAMCLMNVLLLVNI